MAVVKKTISTKMSGAGNDFIITNLMDRRDKLDRYFPRKPLSEITQIICDRHHHIGADGAVFLIPSEKGSHFAWEFFNADGSVAEMCGNAARCVTLYAFKNDMAPQRLVFDAIVGPIHAEVLSSDKVSVRMPPPKEENWGESLSMDGFHVKYDYLDTGVPHMVHQLSQYHVDEALLALARKLRRHEHFLPHGANITFYAVEAINALRSITFERGVEGWTLACGTGAVATACSYAHQMGGCDQPIDIYVPGGQLTIDLSGDHPQLIGPAKFIADVEFMSNVIAQGPAKGV